MACPLHAADIFRHVARSLGYNVRVTPSLPLENVALATFPSRSRKAV